MSIWDLIRDWFVQYIWGGSISSGEFYNGGFFGTFYDKGTNNYASVTLGSGYISLNNGIYEDVGEGFYSYISIGDWLSTTSTIIVLVLLLIAFGYLIVNLFKMFSNIFSLKR